VSWRLIGPDGRQVFLSEMDVDQDTLVAPLSGRYTLLVEGRTGNDADPARLPVPHLPEPARSPVPIGGLGRPAGTRSPRQLARAGAGRAALRRRDHRQLDHDERRQPAGRGRGLGRSRGADQRDDGRVHREALVPYDGTIAPTASVLRTSPPIILPRAMMARATSWSRSSSTS
jgi:hypothetical protein